MGIIANFDTVIKGDSITDEWKNEYADELANNRWLAMGNFREEPELPVGFENYVCIDVTGSEFKWMNEAFPKEKFKWYLWFESIFLVPPEMATFLKLRWA